MWKRMPGFTPTLTPLLQGLGLASKTPEPVTPTNEPVSLQTPVTPTKAPSYDPKEVARMSDPKTFGPGQWQAIHTYAKHATTDETKRAFMDYMKIICNNLKCDKCRGHAMDYLAKNPMKDFMNIKNAEGIEIGMLKWTWIFHNSVNSRLGKPLMDWETCYAMYGDPTIGVCQKDCGNDSAIGVTASTRQSEFLINNNASHAMTEEPLRESISVKTFLNGDVIYTPRRPNLNLKMAPKNV